MATLPQSDGFLKTLVETWKAKLQLAKKDREAWERTAKTCAMFTFEDTWAMWEGDFKTKLGEDIESPQFKITMNKGFEFLAIFGPYLFWDYPQRNVEPVAPMEINPLIFGDPMDPYAQGMAQQYTMQQQMELAGDTARCEMMERYLNYTPREQPYGGLENAVNYAITDALITGRGVLVPRTYGSPGDDRTLTGCFYENVFDFFVDPDCNDPALTTAKWVALRHVSPRYEVERRFGLEPDALKKCVGVSSVDAAAVRKAKKPDASNDLVTWYEIWSKCGMGFRLQNNKENYPLLMSESAQRVEDVCGDYCYICMVEGCDYPLNMPSTQDVDDEQLFEDSRWPFESWRDNRWPVIVLDFYPQPRDCWPQPPLAPALGELIAMNILMCAFVDMAYEGRKQIIAYYSDLAKNLESMLKSKKSTAYFKLDPSSAKSINDAVSFLERPPVNMDLMNARDRLAIDFDKRTGLVEFMYAMSDTQDRSATSVKAKEEKSSIRPEAMARKVAKFMSEAATLEAALASQQVTGADIEPLLGPTLAQLWDALIVNVDPNVKFREFRATIEADDIKKPNKERKAQNLQAMLQFMGPVMQEYGMMTGNWEPWNGFVVSMGDAMEQRVEQMLLPSLPPPQPEQTGPPPPTEQEQQAAANEDSRAEEKHAADLKKTEAETKSIDQKTKNDTVRAKAQAKAANRRPVPAKR